MNSKIVIFGNFSKRQNRGVPQAVNTLARHLHKHGRKDIEYITHETLVPTLTGRMLRKILLLWKTPPKNRLLSLFYAIPYSIWPFVALRTLASSTRDLILHVQSLTVFPALMQSKIVPRKLILTYHGYHVNILEEDYTNPYSLKVLLGVPDVIIADDFDRKVLVERGNRHFKELTIRKKICVFPHAGVDEEIFNPDKAYEHRTYKALRNKEKVLIVLKTGCLGQLKGDFLIMKAAKDLLRKRKDIVFMWAGYFRKESDRKKFGDLFLSLRNTYPHNVMYIGQYGHQEAPSILKGADVYLGFHTKKECSLSLSEKEAMMMGKYVVAKNIGWYERILEGCSGLHVIKKPHANAIDALVKELDYLADNHDYSKKAGIESRKFALEHFCGNVTARRHMKVYDAVMNDLDLPSSSELLRITS